MTYTSQFTAGIVTTMALVWLGACSTPNTANGSGIAGSDVTFTVKTADAKGGEVAGPDLDVATDGDLGGNDVDGCSDCPSPVNATAVCEGGVCGYACLDGFLDCDGKPDNGCEVDRQNDATHCGTCGVSCLPSACIKGTCECASTSSKATLIPLDLFIMLDQSGSMKDATGTGASKWDAVTQALNAFISDSASDGIGVGIQYFGIGSSKNPSCKIADYAVPEVPIGVLPGNAKALLNSIAAHSPSSGTPTSAALQGAIQYAQAHALQNPQHAVAVVLATDGKPKDCTPNDIPGIANLAAAGAKGSPKILTFVIGVGKELADMDAIAVGGGTKQAFVVDTAGNVLQQFGAALKAIQGQAIGCVYALPKPPAGQALQTDKVNVQVTLANAAAVVLDYTANKSACDPMTGGWYYDDPVAPSQILLCPATCAAVSEDPNAKVDVLLGCARVGKGN